MDGAAGSLRLEALEYQRQEEGLLFVHKVLATNSTLRNPSFATAIRFTGTSCLLLQFPQGSFDLLPACQPRL
jgi:hypothetical protein